MRALTILTPEGRRAWSFLAICGAGMVFTVYAAVSLWMVRNQLSFVFWHGMAAHAHIFLVLGALGWALGRRMLGKVGRDGAEFDDREAASQFVADKAQDAANVVKEGDS